MKSDLSPALIVIAALMPALGCSDVSWPDPQYVDSLRVLAVKAEPPALAPNGTTDLTLLCADGRRGPKEDPACQVETAWFGACNNPPKNDPKKCFDHYRSWGRALSPTISETPSDAWPEGFTFGPSRQFQAPDDVLTDEIEVLGQTIRYGTSYVYFASCAGKLVTDPGVDQRLPVACVDPESSQRLGQDRFVVGITTLYSYGGLTTRNPEFVNRRFVGWQTDSPLSDLACSDTESCPDGFACSDGHVCLPSVPPCNRSVPHSCDWHCLAFEVKKESFLLFRSDGVALPSPTKLLWVQFFTNAGVLPDDNGFALDPPKADGGVTFDSCIPWRAPPAATENAHVWVVVRDDRGGVATWDQRVLVR